MEGKLVDRHRRKPDNGVERFRRLWETHFAKVSGYVLRRTSGPDAAADCVAETFSIAWTKLGDVPEGDQALFWLYAV
ncbi:MAG: RNA polymerase sigma factor, partial [Acidimicrobiales bacterium]